MKFTELLQDIAAADGELQAQPSETLVDFTAWEKAVGCKDKCGFEYCRRHVDESVDITMTLAVEQEKAVLACWSSIFSTQFPVPKGSDTRSEKTFLDESSDVCEDPNTSKAKLSIARACPASLARLELYPAASAALADAIAVWTKVTRPDSVTMTEINDALTRVAKCEKTKKICHTPIGETCLANADSVSNTRANTDKSVLRLQAQIITS